MSEHKEERLLELLSDKAVFGLTPDEAAELAALEEQFDAYDEQSFELAAAAIAMVGLESDEQLPAHLSAKIAADAATYFAPAAVAVREEKEELQKTFEFEPKKSPWSWLGWVVAGFACVALAINIYTTRGLDSTANVKPTPTATPKIELTPAQEREKLLASASDLFRSDWGDIDPKKPFGVKGDVVWSQTAQKGYLRFTNMPVNDRTKETYQLWIFDADQKNPIDGGVFDATENGEVVIPIDAKIKVSKPVMFAVTVEKPGGVVVSDRQKIMVVAKYAA